MSILCCVRLSETREIGSTHVPSLYTTSTAENGHFEVVYVTHIVKRYIQKSTCTLTRANQNQAVDIIRLPQHCNETSIEMMRSL